MQAPPPPDTATDTWSLPAEPLRARVLLAAAVGCLVMVLLAIGLHASLHTSTIQPVIAVAIFITLAGTVLVMMRHHHPFRRFGPANRVTTIRAMLVALAASLLTESASPAIAWTLVVITATVVVLDGIDGWLARRTGMASAFGARFDMETDALFMLVLSALVWRHHKAGWWVIAIGLMRYAFVAGGWMLPWLSRPLRATVRGKTVAIVTLIVLGAALAPMVPAPASALGCAIALGTLAWSFGIDVLFLWRRR